MSDRRVKIHPEYNVLVCTDGTVCIPATKYRKSRWTKGSKTRNGYMATSLGEHKNILVHRLVAETFLQNPENLPTVDHINRIRDDNRLENLRWASHKDNMRNTVTNDRCMDRVGLHTYDDLKEYRKRNSALWYSKNREAVKEYRHSQEYRDKENKRRRERYSEQKDKILDKQRRYRHNKNPEMKWSKKYGYCGK